MKNEKGLAYEDRVRHFLGAEEGVGQGNEGADGLLGGRFSIEAKNRQRIAIRSSLRQAEKQAEDGQVPIAVVADKHEQGRAKPVSESLVVLRLKDFKNLAIGEPDIAAFKDGQVLVWEGRDGEINIARFSGGSFLVRPVNTDMVSVVLEDEL